MKINCCLVNLPQGILLVDSGLPRNLKQTSNELSQMDNHRIHELVGVLLTHSDGDPIGSINKMRALTPCPVYDSEIDAEAI